MKYSLALLALALTSCSDAPEAVIAAAPSSRGRPLSVRARHAEVTQDKTPSTVTPRTQEDWRFDTTGLSAGVARLIAELDSESTEHLTRGGLGTGPFSKLFQVPGPRDTTLFAYLRKRFVGDAGCFFVFLEDPANGAITVEPVRYCSTWSAYTDPELRLVDLDGDGVQEVVTMDFFHNGTALNLTVDSYWEVASDLSLRRVLRIAREDAGILIEGSGFGAVSRELVQAEPIDGTKAYRIEVTWQPEAGKPARSVGSATLRFDTETKTWLSNPIGHEELSDAWLEQLSSMANRADEF